MPIPSMSEFRNYLQFAAEDVFMTTFGERPVFVPPEMSVGGLSAIIGLNGNVSGFFAPHIMPKDACVIAGNMLGDSFAEVDDIVCDAIGEIANMLGGSLKKFSSRNGELFRISIPTIVHGNNYQTYTPKGTEQLLMGVRVLSTQITMQLVIKNASMK